MPLDLSEICIQSSDGNQSGEGQRVECVCVSGGRPVAPGLGLGGVLPRPTIVINRNLPQQRRAALKAGYTIVYCGRGSDFGNKYRAQTEADRPRVIALHTADVLHSPVMMAKVVRELTGVACECFCHPKACHCDLYARICNGKL